MYNITNWIEGITQSRFDFIKILTVDVDVVVSFSNSLCLILGIISSSSKFSCCKNNSKIKDILVWNHFCTSRANLTKNRTN